jgi:hypothetical protein
MPAEFVPAIREAIPAMHRAMDATSGAHAVPFNRMLNDALDSIRRADVIPRTSYSRPPHNALDEWISVWWCLHLARLADMMYIWNRTREIMLDLINAFLRTARKHFAGDTRENLCDGIDKLIEKANTEPDLRVLEQLETAVAQSTSELSVTTQTVIDYWRSAESHLEGMDMLGLPFFSCRIALLLVVRNCVTMYENDTGMIFGSSTAHVTRAGQLTDALQEGFVATGNSGRSCRLASACPFNTTEAVEDMLRDTLIKMNGIVEWDITVV